MNLKQIIKNLFAKFKAFRQSLVAIVPDEPTKPIIEVNQEKINDNAEFLKWRDGTQPTAFIPGDGPPARSDIGIDLMARRDPMVKIYQEVRQELGREKVSDNEALGELVNIQTTRSATALNNHVSDLLNGSLPGGFVMAVDPGATAELQRELDAIMDEPTPSRAYIGIEILPKTVGERVKSAKALNDLDSLMIDAAEKINQAHVARVQEARDVVGESMVDDPDRTVAVMPMKDVSLEEFAKQYPVHPATLHPSKLPPYLTKPGKKLNRSEKKKLKALQQQENLKMKRGQTPPPPKFHTTGAQLIAPIDVQEIINHPMTTDFAEAVVANNKSISEMIDELEDGSYVAPVRVAAPGVFVPPVSEVMGEDYGADFRWTHPDDLFINFKILTRIVVSDPAFFSKYIQRTLDKEDLNAYSIDYCECFAAVEELAPVEDLGAIAIMDQESYCILVAWQNVFGMIILNQDDVIDIKRRSAGFEDPHPTGYYHMTFARFDPEALIRMDLVGRHEYGYAEQIPHFKVNFAKFNHEEADTTPTPTPSWTVNPSF